MADTEGLPTEKEQHENTAQTAQTSLENESQSEVNSLRHSAPGKLASSGWTRKRHGVADFDIIDDEVLDEFDPLKEFGDNSSSQTTAKPKSLAVVMDDKNLARHSAPGLLFGSQSDEEMPSELGASGFSHFGSEDDILVGTNLREQRDFEDNGFDADLERATRKELESLDQEDSGNPVYPSFSSEASDIDFHSIARHQIVSVSGSDKSGRLVIVFSACHLPPVHQIDHHKLLQYIKHTLDQYVESDYTIVYFHYGLTSKNKPSFYWLRQVYRELERKYRKNVKAMYIVHPSNLIKVVWGIFRKVISHKFAKKVTYVNCLQELSEHIHLNQLDIPKEVQEHDNQLMLRYKPRQLASSVFHTSLPEIPTTQQFGVSLSWIKEHNNGEAIPMCVYTSVTFLTEFGLDVEGIFRRSANSSLVKQVAHLFNLGKTVDYSELGDIHCAAAIIKKFLRELPEPLLTFELCDVIPTITAIPDRDEKLKETRKVLHSQLPSQNYELLKYIMIFLKEVQAHPVNKMTASNLAIVFGPNLVWGKTQAASLDALAQVNTFTCLMLENIDNLFGDDRS